MRTITEQLASLGGALQHAQHGVLPFGTVPFVAISANTGDSATHEQVVAQFGTVPHRAITRDTPTGRDVVGWWDDSLAATRLVPGATLATGAALGQKYHQKALLHWQPDPQGPHVLHVVHHGHPSPLGAAAEAYARGIQGGSADGHHTYIVDTDGGLARAVASLPGEKESHRGHATFLDAGQYSEVLRGA